MSEEHVKIVLSAEDRASAEITKLQRSLDKLKKSFSSFSVNPIKGQFGTDMGAKVREDLAKTQASVTRGLDRQMVFQTRMNRQRLSEERAVSAEQARQDRARRIGEDRAMRDLRQRTTAETRAIREQAGMARDAERARTAGMRETIRLDNYRFGLRQRHEREVGRDLAATARETVRLDNYRFNLRQRHERDLARDRARADRQGATETRAADRRRADVRRSVSRGFTEGRDVSGRIVDASRTVSILGTVGAGIIAKLGSVGLEARSRADTAEANLRMFGGQSRDQVNATRSEWLNRSAVDFGFRPADALNAFTEVLKAGIPQIAAKDVTRSIMGASAGLDLDVPETTKLVGRLSTLTQDPKAFSAGAIDKMLNGIAVVAKVTAADSKELVSSLRRGAGALGASKMSVTDLTAFTGTGISAGMQEGKAGTFMDFLVNELVNAKNSRGQRRDDLTKGFNLLGLGSNTSVSRQAANDPTKLLLSMFDKMSKMSPEKAGQVASLIGMREWRGEILQMMKANPMLRQTVEASRDPKNSGHLKQASDEKLGTLAGLRSQLVATFDLAWEAVGGGIEDIVREISTFFINFGKNLNLDVIKAHVHTLIDGFVDGLGFKNITEMLEAAFGKPEKMDFSTLNSFFEFAQGFGRGVREVIDTIKSVVSSFTGANMDAGALGNLTAKVLGFSFALVAIAPYVSVLAGLATAVGAFAITIGSIATALRAAGLVGGAGAAASGGLLSAGAMATAGGLLGAAFLATVANKLGILKMDENKGILGNLAEEFVPAPLRRWLDKPATPDAKVQKQSFDVETTGSIAALVKKASYSGYDDRDDETRRVASGIEDLRAILQKATLTNGGIGASVSSSMSGGSGGGSGGGGSGGSGRFFTPPDMKVPGWYGQGKGAPGGSGGAPGSDTASPDQKSGGSRSWRNNNPGNIEFGPFARSMGATSSDGRFAKFPSYEAGRKAQEKLLFESGSYKDLTLNGAIRRWAPASENNVPAYLKAMGGDPGKRMSEYSPEQRAKLLDAMQAHEGWKVGTVAGGKGPSNDPVAAFKGSLSVPGVSDGSKVGNAVDIAGKFLGKNENRDRSELSSFMGHDVVGSLNAWCARFVNSSLRDAGVKGSGSAMANSFLAWGDKVDAEATKKGDVLVEHRNRGVNAGGGHVGFATGNKRVNKQTGELELEMLSGNHGDAVVKDWINASKVAVRRSSDAAATAAATSLKEIGATAKQAQDGGSERLQPPKGGKVDIGGGMRGVPLGAKPTTDEVVGNVPAGIGRGGAGGGGGGQTTIHNTMHINGGDKSPAEIANLAQRKITEDWNHRGHDLEPELT